MTVAEIMEYAKSLSPPERKELVMLLIESLEVVADIHTPAYRLSDLRGIGEVMWQDIDTISRLDDIRDEWSGS